MIGYVSVALQAYPTDCNSYIANSSCLIRQHTKLNALQTWKISGASCNEADQHGHSLCGSVLVHGGVLKLGGSLLDATMEPPELGVIVFFNWQLGSIRC